MARWGWWGWWRPFPQLPTYLLPRGDETRAWMPWIDMRVVAKIHELTWCVTH